MEKVRGRESVRGCLGNAAVLMDTKGYAEDKVDSSKATLTKSMQNLLNYENCISKPLL